jgi:hypothetical protein
VFGAHLHSCSDTTQEVLFCILSPKDGNETDFRNVMVLTNSDGGQNPKQIDLRNKLPVAYGVVTAVTVKGIVLWAVT